MNSNEREQVEARIVEIKKKLTSEKAKHLPHERILGHLEGNVGALEWVLRELDEQCHCENRYIKIEECPRCTPVRKDGRCNRCGTMGDHYCPADVARS